MSTTSIEAFDTTVQKTNEWLRDISRELGDENRRHAYLALRGTLHAVRDFLPLEESARLSAQLPMLVRGFYYEGWDPTGKPTRDRTQEEFLARIWRELPPNSPMEPDAVARAVFRLLSERIAEGEIDEVRHILPEDIRELWPTAAVAEAVSGSGRGG